MVKKLLLSILILTLSWNSFSQNVTEIRDTSKIVLTTEVARAVAVDLVEGDQAREEVKILGSEILELKSIITLQDSLGIMRENQISNLEKVIQLQQIQTQQSRENYERLNKDLRKQSNLKVLFEATTGAAVVGLIVAIVLGKK